jgi:hypothetical protein
MFPERADGAEVFHHRAFGLPVRSYLRLPGLAPAAPRPGALTVGLASRAEIERLWSGPGDEPVWSTAIDGRPYTMELGEGDYLMTYGDEAVFLLSAGVRELRCAPTEHRTAAWQRFLLDTVLWSASLLSGIELLHASAVQGAAGVAAFAGFSGDGKTSLARELVRRGGALFSDDILALPPVTSELRAHPGPALMNVPREGARSDRLGDLGPVLAHFPDEDWVTVARAAVEPNRIAAVCLLRRRSGATLALRRLQATVLDLLPFTLGFPHLSGRMRQRFTLFARLATETPIYELSAPPDAPPASLADLVEPLIFRGVGQAWAA